MKYICLYNPHSCGGKGLEETRKIEELVPAEDITYVDITEIEDVVDYINSAADEKIVLCGGDGTINHFVNNCNNRTFNKKINYYPAGSGNDFWNDVMEKKEKSIIELDRYIENLPEVTVNGRTWHFINNVGYGIDGYCCEEGDNQRRKNAKRVNYTSIALKGLLYAYKPVNAVVTIDGVTKTYRRVWLAPTMNGRFYGGGMMATPMQDRTNKEHTVTVMVAHDLGKLSTLMMFPKIFSGKHTGRPDVIEFTSGHDIKVKFDRPTSLQIDGETVLGVSEYAVKTK